MAGNKTGFFWPNVQTMESAKQASMYGVWAAGFTAITTSVVALISIYSGETVMGLVDASAFIDVILFVIIGIGIYKESRFAAVAGLLLFIYEKYFQIQVTGQFQGAIVALVIIIAYIGSIRGTYALKRMRGAIATTDSLLD